MKNIVIPLVAVVLLGCNVHSQTSPVTTKKILAKELKEISGIAASGNDIWAITDKPKAAFYRLDKHGNLVQRIQIKDAKATDIEAISADNDFLYIGDVGDNNGNRKERQILKVYRKEVGTQPDATTKAEVITFTFPDEKSIADKKDNNYDCESLLSYKNLLYVFTKDREDKETRLYSLPKTPGAHTAKLINSFNAGGLITDASVNAANNQVALIGYHKGHKNPFMLFFKDFTGDDFFSGKHTRVVLADKPWDWQLEGVTFAPDNMLYFSCEGTKQVPATFYGIKTANIKQLDKKEQQAALDNDDDDIHMSLKGHLRS